MEQWEVLAVDKTAKITIKAEGKVINGARLLLKGDEPTGEKDRFIGFNWHDQFISNDRLDKLLAKSKRLPAPGDIIQLMFNRYGDIEDLVIV